MYMYLYSLFKLTFQFQGYGGASAPPGGAPPGGYPGGAPPGGYGAPPRPQVDPNVQQWFNAVDQDKSGQITASELQKALVNGNWSHFSEEACRMMIGELMLLTGLLTRMIEFKALSCLGFVYHSHRGCFHIQSDISLSFWVTCMKYCIYVTHNS